MFDGLLIAVSAVRPEKRPETAKQTAEKLGVSERTVRRLIAQPRDEWRAEQAGRRERIRAYHDDEKHSWTQTAQHFKLHVDTVKRLSYRARKERAAEREAQRKAEHEAANPPLF